jgi:hypothetical protein
MIEKNKKSRALTFFLALIMVVGTLSYGSPVFAGAGGASSGASNTQENQTLIAPQASPLDSGVKSGNFKDTGGHWGAAAINRWNSSQILTGYEDGSFRPDSPITRGEFAVIIDRIMKYKSAAANTFSDLDNAFYTEAILKANAAGVINGDGSGVRPKAPITREEATVILARAFGISGGGSASSFKDASAVSSWATEAVSALSAKGYVKGSDGSFRPKSSITRAEVSTILDNAISSLCSSAGTYSGGPNLTIVNAPDVTIKSGEIGGGLIITEGVGGGEVTLDTTNVAGGTNVLGGGKLNVAGGNAGTISINKNDGGFSVNITSNGTADTINVAKGSPISLSGKISSVSLKGQSTLNLTGANVSSINVGAAGSSLSVDKASTVATLNIVGAAKNVTLNNAGSITTLNIEAGATGAKINNTGTIKTTNNKAAGGKTTPGGVSGGTSGGGSSGGSGQAKKVAIDSIKIDSATSITLTLKADRRGVMARDLAVTSVYDKTTASHEINTVTAVSGSLKAYVITLKKELKPGSDVTVTAAKNAVTVSGAASAKYDSSNASTVSELENLLKNDAIKVVNITKPLTLTKGALDIKKGKEVNLAAGVSLTLTNSAILSGSGMINLKEKAVFVNGKGADLSSAFGQNSNVSIKVEKGGAIYNYDKAVKKQLPYIGDAKANMSINKGSIIVSAGAIGFNGESVVNTKTTLGAPVTKINMTPGAKGEVSKLSVKQGAELIVADSAVYGKGEITVDSNAIFRNHADNGDGNSIWGKGSDITLVFKNDSNVYIKSAANQWLGSNNAVVSLEKGAELRAKADTFTVSGTANVNMDINVDKNIVLANGAALNLKDGVNFSTNKKMSLGDASTINFKSTGSAINLTLENGASLAGKGKMLISENAVLVNKTGNAGRDMWSDDTAKIVVNSTGMTKNGNDVMVGAGGVVVLGADGMATVSRNTISFGGTVTMDQTITLSDNVTLEKGAKVTIATGKELTIESGYTLTVSETAALTVDGGIKGTDAKSKIEIKANAALDGAGLSGLTPGKTYTWDTTKGVWQEI